jgi:hypothetical protein
MPQRVQLPRVEALTTLFEPLLQEPREREIHVVAAEQDVIADGDALEYEIPLVLGDRDQRKVRRAAAHIAHGIRSPTRMRRRHVSPCVSSQA